MTLKYCTTSHGNSFNCSVLQATGQLLRRCKRRVSITVVVMLLWGLCVGDLSVAAQSPVVVAAGFHQAQGSFAGEATSTTILLQTRLTAIPGPMLDPQGDIPGRAGLVRFQWSRQQDFGAGADGLIETGAWLPAVPERDFIVRQLVTGLEPDTRYFYRAQFAPLPRPASEFEVVSASVGSFRTLGNAQKRDELTFCMGSCMNYYSFMSGNANGGGPVTATAEDKQLGYRVFESLRQDAPDFFIGTGDIVYYDHPGKSPARQKAELLKKWHEQFRFPRLVQFFSHTTSYWSKDDHDFRFNDADLKSNRLPTAMTGIDLFRLQMPIVPSGNDRLPTYRSHRPHHDLQLWFLEGRDYRSPNQIADGPEKTIWGDAQKAWLKETLLSSEAHWKILISPTPVVGPDRASKRDNHTNPKGFRHEGMAFMQWLKDEGIQGVIVFCGDRHWQYHSVHPLGLEEFCCGALNDENAIRGTYSADKGSTDPEQEIDERYHYEKPSGGYLKAMVGSEGQLVIELKDDEGRVGYRTEKRR